ncbi:septum site-determining protein MinC [Rhizobiales bacterium GAS191]|nr:septum site-determining protein MinC [Rhizobiales bacterium GAS188]SED29749.1 septum site-determining protein MinC [Rhizobiales bacterium GAS191]
MTETSSRHIRFRGRSFPVLALEPESPLSEWIERLDAHLARTPAFFRDKSIAVDVSGLGLARSGVVGLMRDLSERGIRVMGITGVELSWASADLPPILAGGRPVPCADRATSESAKTADGASSGQLSPEQQDAFEEIGRALGGPRKHGLGKASAPEATQAATVPPLIVNSPVRSGQSISHPEGDVTVIGSVASGAEVIAGGSVHIYGALRGRVMAGAYGEMRSRIFCRRLEAELLAVGGVYITADEIEANVRSQAVQAWLENETVKIARLD